MSDFSNLNEDKNWNHLIQKAQDEASKEFDMQQWFKDNPVTRHHKVSLKFNNESTNEDPSYSTEGSSGFDLRANLGDGQDLVMEASDYFVIPTGLFFEIPRGYEIQIRPRSGMAAKHGVTVLNTPGTIDCVPKGTKISTPNGDILVEELFDKNEKYPIYSYDMEEGRIVEDIIGDMWVVEGEELISISTEDNVIEVPKNKEVLTKNGWKSASNLTLEDEILTII